MHEGVSPAVSIGIFQQIQELIIPLFVNADNTSVSSASQHTETIAFRKIRLHIPTAATLVFVKIRPPVYRPVLIKQETVYRTVKHFRTVYKKRH